jgi:hypothetical protein
MSFFRTPRSAALTTLAIVLIVIGLAGLAVGQTVAAAAPFPAFGGPFHGNGAAWAKSSLPPELSGLADVPAADRFAHFRGVQLSLTDKDNKPLLVNVTPGVVTAVSASSLTVNGNDGTSHTYAIDSKTLQNDNRPLKQNDQVVVATVNNSTTATAVFPMQGDGWHGRGGPWGR